MNETQKLGRNNSPYKEDVCAPKLQSLIKEREETFDRKFTDYDNDGGLVFIGDRDQIKSFHRESIRKTLEVVREVCEGMKKPIMVVGVPKGAYATYDNVRVDEIPTYNQALSDLSAQIGKVLESLPNKI